MLENCTTFFSLSFVTCQISQPIQPISTQIGLYWLCYLAGNFQTAPTFFSKFQVMFIFNYCIRTRKPQLPSLFWPIFFWYTWCGLLDIWLGPDDVSIFFYWFYFPLHSFTRYFTYFKIKFCPFFTGHTKKLKVKS